MMDVSLTSPLPDTVQELNLTEEAKTDLLGLLSQNGYSVNKMNALGRFTVLLELKPQSRGPPGPEHDYAELKSDELICATVIAIFTPPAKPPQLIKDILQDHCPQGGFKFLRNHLLCLAANGRPATLKFIRTMNVDLAGMRLTIWDRPDMSDATCAQPLAAKD